MRNPSTTDNVSNYFSIEIKFKIRPGQRDKLTLIDANDGRTLRGAARKDISEISGLMKFTCPPLVF